MSIPEQQWPTRRQLRERAQIEASKDATSKPPVIAPPSVRPEPTHAVASPSTPATAVEPAPSRLTSPTVDAIAPEKNQALATLSPDAFPGRRIHASATANPTHTSPRPTPPRRSVFSRTIGAVGVIFVTMALIIGMFVVWELWGTDISSISTQTASTDTFQSQSKFVSAPSHVGVKQTGPAPTIPQAVHMSTIGTLHIPTFGEGFNVPIIQNATQDSSENSPDRYNILNKGLIGHYNFSAMPGQVGNFAVAGHRTTYGHPFKPIAELTQGDEIIVETDSYWFVYTVTSHEIVTPDNANVLDPVPGKPGVAPTQATITLTTCNPEYSAAQRYVVYGTLSYWMNKSSGVPAALMGKGTSAATSSGVMTKVSHLVNRPTFLGWATTIVGGFACSIFALIAVRSRRRPQQVGKKHWARRFFIGGVKWVLCSIVIAALIYACYRWAFPWIAPHMPFQDGGGAITKP